MVIKGNLEKIGNLDISIIAPSHGPAYDNPDFILSAYKDWVSDEVKNEVVIPYVSMHGSTKKMVDYLVKNLIERGISVRQFNLSEIDLGKLSMALVDAATIVIGSPTVLVGPHPNVVSVAYLVNALRPKLRFASVIGSYSWGGKMVDQLTTMISGLKVNILSPVVIKGFPKEKDFMELERLADEIFDGHKELGIIERGGMR